MTTSATQVWTDVDYSAAGKQVDYLHLPHSVNRSAYGTIAIPIAVIANGQAWPEPVAGFCDFPTAYP